MIELNEKYLNLDSLSELDDKTSLNIFGTLIDTSHFLDKLEGLLHALDFSEELLNREMNEENKSELHYYIANLWADLEEFKSTCIKSRWDWDQPEIKKVITNIRYSFRYGFLGDNTKVSDSRRCEILTNYGNALSQIGRIIEAIEYYDKVLEINPNFSMANGAKGNNLFKYSRYLYDEGHKAYFLNLSYKMLKKAIEGDPYPQAKKNFQNTINILEKGCSKELLAENFDLNSYELGNSQDEIDYRNWVLNNRLFLNPLNDLGPNSIAARDVLLTPSIFTKIDEGPYYQGFYNQMKQEFVSARYLFYEGITQRELHFSDFEVMLFNTGDFPRYGLKIEKIKIAYRMAYSLFDKIAFFINYYFRLGLKEKETNFKSIWYKKQKGNKPLEIRGDLYKKENLPLRGLFWLNQDFFIEDFKESIEPESEELKNIRNSLEHKYLKIHSDYYPINCGADFSMYGEDRLAYSLNYNTFISKTLKLLKLTRSALIYLSLAIYTEEFQRYSNSEKMKDAYSIEIDVFSDDDKKLD
ncbi:LA2681 family HEPN domain-containing protein [Methanolacinia petrolearia]|nr:LA2681 family HEPN domain-containing protein [Methanolacinia petrolearia]